jgi:hypothetical protein
MTLLN